MVSVIHIVELTSGEKQIVDNIKDITSNMCKVQVREYDEESEGYFYQFVDARIVKTFQVITRGEFVRRLDDKSTTNAYTMTSGSFVINGLAYVYSVNIISAMISNHLWDSDLIYSDSGIRQTKYSMYSYHTTDDNGVHTYNESTLEREVYNSLNFDIILSEYLDSQYLRNSKLETILDK